MLGSAVPGLDHFNQNSLFQAFYSYDAEEYPIDAAVAAGNAVAPENPAAVCATSAQDPLSLVFDGGDAGVVNQLNDALPLAIEQQIEPGHVSLHTENTLLTDQIAQNTSNQLTPTIPLRKEHLQMTIEEAFFLSYALGCLEISTEDGVGG